MNGWSIKFVYLTQAYGWATGDLHPVLSFSEAQIDQLGGRERAIHNCPRSNFYLHLKSDDGFSVPAAAFTINFSNGESITGELDENGDAQVRGAPPNTGYKLRFLNEDDVRYKIFAARLKNAIEHRDTEYIISILALDQREISLISTIFSEYFGCDLADGCLEAARGSEEHEELVEGFLYLYAPFKIENMLFERAKHQGDPDATF